MTKPGDRGPLDRSSMRDRAQVDAPHENADRPRPPPIRWQFGLPALLGTMLLLCLPFAIWGAILRANETDQLLLMLLCTAAPLGVLLLAALTVSVIRFVQRLRRRRHETRYNSPDAD
ncbi:MAG TPA: hypothetical protein VHC22_31030 [Pirellulales bacterium]|nr:hypothetical protein [Pirellulales bacterium]